MRCHAHVVEDVRQLARVDAAVVGHVVLAALVHVDEAHWNRFLRCYAHYVRARS